MADDWRGEAMELTRRAFEIANSPEADEVRAETLIGGGSLERAMTFGTIAAICEMHGSMQVELGDQAEPEDPELAALREENERLRAILETPPSAPAEGEEPTEPVTAPESPPADATAEEIAEQNQAMHDEAFGSPDAEVPTVGLPPLEVDPSTGEEIPADERTGAIEAAEAEQASGEPEPPVQSPDEVSLGVPAGTLPGTPGDGIPDTPDPHPVDPDAHSKEELIAMAEAAGVSTEGTKAQIAERLTHADD